MLVLSRRPNEAIQLKHKTTGEIIRVTVVRIGPNTVRIGTECGQHWNIARTELLSRTESNE